MIHQQCVKIHRTTWFFGFLFLVLVIAGCNGPFYPFWGGPGGKAQEHGPPAADWEPGNSLPGTRITAIGFGGDTFVAGGANGEIAHSPNGVDWTTVESTGFSAGINAFAYYGSDRYRFVVVGESGLAGYAHAQDVSTWTTTSVPGTTNPIKGVVLHVYHNPIVTRNFICVKQSGEIYRSLNGSSWNSHDRSFSINTVNALGYSGTYFVAVGDGIAWIQLPFGRGETVTITGFTGTVNCVASSGGSTFVAGALSGKIFYSRDDIGKWYEANSTFDGNPVNGIAFGGGYFVAVGDGGKMAWASGSDPKNWNTIDTSATFGTTTSINAVAYGKSMFVAGGNNGKIAYWKP